MVYTDLIGFFKKIASIPHCSGDAEALRQYLCDFSEEKGYNVQIDKAGNILAVRGEARLCLQAHYDMVCMGRAPDIALEERDGCLHARSSSLGADNGMGIAMMMALMAEGVEAEFLFTADEEIGLIGAHALELKPRATQMLNLDSEEEAQVCIGCAGGADIVAQWSDEMVPGTGVAYEVAVRGLPGGHSGVDIDKNIPSAIKVLAAYLYDEGIEQLSSIIAGERRNAIPANAVAIVRSEHEIESRGEVRVRALQERPDVYRHSRMIIEYLHGFRQGVHRWNERLDIPQTSINLAMVNDAYGTQGLTIETSVRAMSMDDLEMLIAETVSEMEMAGFSIRIEDKYPAWKPDPNALSRRVETAMRHEFGRSRTMAIHAGLECGVLSQKFPRMQFASIGPAIRYPHSTRECVDLESVERTYRVVRSIVLDG